MSAVTTASKRLGRLLPQSSVLFVCDIQEVFRGLTFQLPTVIHGTNTMVRWIFLGGDGAAGANLVRAAYRSRRPSC
jgi:hypothetical protein